MKILVSIFRRRDSSDPMHALTLGSALHLKTRSGIRQAQRILLFTPALKRLEDNFRIALRSNFVHCSEVVFTRYYFHKLDLY
jgi:hypothetical protein